MRGGELLFEAGIFGIGLGLGAVYQRLDPDIDALLIDMVFELRPTVHIAAVRNRWVEPTLYMGGLMGGPVDDPTGEGFIGVYYLGGGIDSRLWTGTKYPIATVRYRWAAAGDNPEGIAAHTLLFGLGFRLDDTSE